MPTGPHHTLCHYPAASQLVQITTAGGWPLATSALPIAPSLALSLTISNHSKTLEFLVISVSCPPFILGQIPLALSAQTANFLDQQPYCLGGPTCLSHGAGWNVLPGLTHPHVCLLSSLLLRLELWKNLL